MNDIDVGRVSAVYPQRGTAKVVFEDRDNYVTPELPILVKGAQDVKDYWMPTVGEQVVCIFLANSSKTGFILGCYYNEGDKPAVTSKSKRQLSFPDGTCIEYDQETHVLRINVKGKLTIQTTSEVHVEGDVIADGVSLKNHTHSLSGIGDTSGPLPGG